MINIARIRQLINEGKSDAEIDVLLENETPAGANLGWSNPTRTFHSLAATMRRALTEDRAVAAQEVLVQLELFRTIWEEVAASGEWPDSEAVVLRLLAPVTAATSVSEAYRKLHGDMTVLALPARTTPKAKLAQREAIEREYLRTDGAHPIVCVTRAAAAVAEVNKVLFSAFGDRPAYRELFPEAALQPCAPILLMHRPTWRELLANLAEPA
jgi:hypothetical protein